jgi:hypothetical protein
MRPVLLMLSLLATACDTGVQCPKTDFSLLAEGCEFTASECSDGSVYAVTCFGVTSDDAADGVGGFACRCSVDGVSRPNEDNFGAASICEKDKSDEVLKQANLGCAWDLTDPT